MARVLESGAAEQPVDYLERARNLAPLIEQSVAAIERDRRLPPELHAAMVEAELFRMLLPRPFGGAELDPPSFIAVIESIARIDGSTAWILCQTSVTAMVAARLAPEVAREIWRDPAALIAWGPGPEARAIAVEGGYRVTGSWSFASGCWYATWLGGDCTVCDADGTPRRRPNGKPEIRRALFPRGQAKMREIWDVIGLRGTGSDGYSVTDLFVPQAHTVARIDDNSEQRYFAPLYEVSSYTMFAAGFAALALGIGRMLLDSFIALAMEKTPRGFKNTLRQDGLMQAQVGQAEARLRAARAYLNDALGAIWQAAQGRGAVILDQRMNLRLAATHAIREAKAVADIAYDAAGTTAVFASNPFERRFRDIHTVSQQLQGRQSHYQTVGQHILGLEAELGWL